VYNVTIDGMGRVTYEGLQHVAHVGVQRAVIGLEQVETLLNEFLRTRFMQALDEYRTREFLKYDNGEYRRMAEDVSDLPGAILTLKLGPRTKRVVLYYAFPAELGRLPSLVDRAANTEQWTGRPPTPAPNRPGA